MSYAKTILPEFDQEMANTRKVLERVPDDKLDWQPHPKSHTIGWNANHIADIPKWIVMVLSTPSLDIAPVGGESHPPAKANSRAEILDVFDRNVADARKAITETNDVSSPWSLLAGGNTIFTMPRGGDALDGPQPPDPPPRPSHRLPPIERRPCPRHVWAIGR